MIHSFLSFKFRLFAELFNEMQQFFLTKFDTHLHIHMFKARKRSVLLLSSADYSANWIRRQMESNEFKIPATAAIGQLSHVTAGLGRWRKLKMSQKLYLNVISRKYKYSHD